MCDIGKALQAVETRCGLWIHSVPRQVHTKHETEQEAEERCLTQEADLEFEVCAEQLNACVAARNGGANRIELCSALSEGGLTPSHGLIQAAVRSSGLPVHAILRPRGGDFVYSDVEYDLMRTDLLHARELGASGVVVGLLDRQGKVDVPRTSRLVELASPLQVTFHRAFDCVKDLPQALEDVIASGCGRLLTSGGMPDVWQGAEALAQLVTQAEDRIHVAVGGGLRLEHAAAVARITKATAYHGSMRRRHSSAYGCVPGEENCVCYTVEAGDIQIMIATLQAALRAI